VLNRQDDTEKSTRQMSALLDGIPLNDESSVDRVLALCDSLGLAAQRKAIAEVRLSVPGFRAKRFCS
jgi:hypothetical protein